MSKDEVVMRFSVRNTLSVAAIFSLLFHFSVWTGLWISKAKDKSIPNKPIEVVVLDQRPDTEPKRMQIVEQNDKSLNDEVPEDAKYLGQHNQRVVKETRAANQGDFRNSAGQGITQTPAKTAPQPEKSKTALKEKFKGTIPSLADLKPKFDPSVVNRDTKATGQGGAPSQTNDYIKDLPPSLETVLSTREFVYFTYYQRIRNQIRQYWEPSIREKVKKIFAAGRSIASEKDHVTRVVIVLDNTGNLIKVQVIGASGLSDLDDAAVEAFRAAEPFPNPPKGIVETDGTIRINWDFILEANLGSETEFQRFAKR